MKHIKPFSIIIALFSLGPFSNLFGQTQKRDIFELRIYHIDSPVQEKRIDAYLKNAFLPALHSSGIPKIGVFKPVLSDEEEKGKKIYVFIPYHSMDQLLELPGLLDMNKAYQKAGKDYINASHDDPNFIRMEIILMRAFAGMPQFQESKLKGTKKDRVYELRSYESATEKQHRTKVKMFNEGEIEIFDKLDFNAVFYGEVIAGAHMPNLMYLTTFSDMESEKEHWDAFRTDPDWERMKVMEEYQNIVSLNDTKLLYPTDYSDL